MDKQKVLKDLGFFGILKETFKLIFSNKKIFSQITLTLIIPLSLILQANILLTQLLSYIFLEKGIDNLENPVDFNTYQYPSFSLSSFQSPGQAASWVSIELAYYVLTLIFSLVCTSVVAFTISCIYSNEDVSLRKAFGIVQKVWKPVLLTSFVSWFIVFAYDIVLGAVLLFTLRYVISGSGFFLVAVILIMFFAGSVYITIVWHLAIVVSVLEDSVFGVKALKRSKFLINPKIKAAMAMWVTSSISSAVIDASFQKAVVHDVWLQGLGMRILIGVVCFLLQLLVLLFNLVVYAVIYFACKSHQDQRSIVDDPRLKATDIEVHTLV